MEDNQIYCPVCERVITAEAKTHDGGYVFVHDEVVHSDSDVEALDYGVN